MCAPIIADSQYYEMTKPALVAERMHNVMLVADKLESVPNDVYLDTTCKLVQVSGPNGSGKTTLLKTICQSLILAQAGCFVPCSKFLVTPFQQLITVAPDIQ